MENGLEVGTQEKGKQYFECGFSIVFFSCLVSFQLSKFSCCRRCKRVYIKLRLFTYLSWHFARSNSRYSCAQYGGKNERKKNFLNINFVSLFATSSVCFVNREFITGTENRRRKYKLSDFFLSFGFCFWTSWIAVPPFGMSLSSIAWIAIECRYIHRVRLCRCLRFNVIYVFHRKAKKMKKICGLSVHRAQKYRLNYKCLSSVFLFFFFVRAVSIALMRYYSRPEFVCYLTFSLLDSAHHVSSLHEPRIRRKEINSKFQ